MNKEKEGAPLQHTKYQELKNDFKVLNERVMRQHQLAQSTLILLKNMDARIEATRELCINKGIFTEQDYHVLVDHKLGLREKDESEDIVVGDVVWVAYKATVEGSDQTSQEDSLPVRVGSNSAVFEPALLGKRTGAKGITFTAQFSKKDEGYAGKSVTFVIDILKVKTKLGGHTDGAELESEPVGDPGAATGDQGSIEPQAESGGPGLESGEPSVSEPLPSGGPDDAGATSDGSGAACASRDGVCRPDASESECPDPHVSSPQALIQTDQP